MCGIAGLWHATWRDSTALERAAERMAETLAHRGPDDSGAWNDAACGIALGHRRLSIVDLSPAGHQPMVSRCGRYIVVFNGEIYNYTALRKELEAAGTYNWHGSSDTEVMLASITRWGFEATLKRCTGMFAIALWDRTGRRLHLARDRLGEKPLYYGWSKDALVFGSEIKAIRAAPSFSGSIDPPALGEYLQFGYIPHPRSIYREVAKVPPGTCLTFELTDVASRRAPAANPFWSLREAAAQGIQDPARADSTELVDGLERLLGESVGRQMLADVPLGAFLSGGVDSSTIVALMQQRSEQPIRTFSIGFSDDRYDEARFARQVARHLGTNHTELYVTADQALDVVPRLAEMYDEPFGDSSQIPTHLVSHLARKHVTVTLSGDGGDELFGGYNRYFWGRSIQRASAWIPPAGRRAVSAAMRGISPGVWDRLFGSLGTVIPQRFRIAQAGDKMHKLARVIAARNIKMLYLSLISQWEAPTLVLGNERGNAVPPWIEKDIPAFGDTATLMMYLDAGGYLPDDILVKVDRAAMAVSLETRVPFLDHAIVEFAFRVPVDLKLRDGRGKWLLRQLLYRYVPPELIDRPKMGFSMPIDAWLRGPLRAWATDLLSPARLQRQGLINPLPVSRVLDEHLSGRRNFQHALWNVLMLQAWLDKSSHGTL